MNNGWTPCSDRMPEDVFKPEGKCKRIKVIVCNIRNGKRSIRTLVRQFEGHWEWSQNVWDEHVTHWRPLPEMPDPPEHIKMEDQ